MRGLPEYRHQVKNLMAVIRSIAGGTAANSTSLEDFMAHFDGRLAVLGRTQHMLTRSAVFETDLEELVREELLAQTASQPVTVEGPTVRLPLKVAENLALAVHELATNAVKFGALSGPGGRLSIAWRVSGEELLLEWRESGVAMLHSAPRRSGFGQEWLERGLTYQLGARTELEFLAGGVCCTIAVPLNLVALDGRP